MVTDVVFPPEIGEVCSRYRRDLCDEAHLRRRVTKLLTGAAAVVRGRARVVLLLGAPLLGLGFVLTCCPSNRDGMSGQLAAAGEETESAARSGALAFDQWNGGHSTRQLTCVQLADARDEVVKAAVRALPAQRGTHDLSHDLWTAATELEDHYN